VGNPVTGELRALNRAAARTAGAWLRRCTLAAKGGTGIYAALLQAQALARSERGRDAGRLISIVLLTDGENTSPALDLADFRGQVPGDDRPRASSP
jgi:Ca-activated chloride channel homolog